ncbi:uncharacterized protein [Antedon mediterranea]|uniref:uncharacterized protein n=1 Tax=Antedon mediterranea TaxID=105859 RepID=UPI003AF4770D
MTSTLKTLLCFLLPIAVLIVSTNGLRCYECHNVFGGSCSEDNFNPASATIVTCNSTDICTKSVVGGLVARGCGEAAGVNADMCSEFLGMFGCMCVTDLCNSASSMTLQITALLASTFLCVVIFA